MTSTILALLLGAATPKVGDHAPEFTVDDADGKPRSLAALRQAGPVVLAFFPKAFTPGCTQELTSYADKAAQLKELGMQLVAISGDDASTLQRFRGEIKATYVFLPDADAKLMELYGVRQWPLKLAKRTTFVVDKAGIVVHIDTGSDAIDPTGALGSGAKL